MKMNKFQVVLHPDCVAHGGRREYPDGWVGTEAIPPRVVIRVMNDSIADVEDATEALAVAQKARKGGVREARTALEAAQGRLGQSAEEAVTTYANSEPRSAENLRYLQFGRHFVGRNLEGREERKTDDQTGMWVPAWILNAVPEPAIATA